MIVVQTERLIVRWLNTGDAVFILQLMNEPSWHRYIGDKGVRTIEEAENYIRAGPMEMYARLGFGLCRVETRARGEVIGICGLIKRESLEDVDVGFAFLHDYWGQGYAFESASAVLAHGKDVLRISRIVAITSQDNDRSIRLLERLGLKFERTMPPNAQGEALKLYGTVT